MVPLPIFPRALTPFTIPVDGISIDNVDATLIALLAHHPKSPISNDFPGFSRYIANRSLIESWAFSSAVLTALV